MKSLLKFSAVLCLALFAACGQKQVTTPEALKEAFDKPKAGDAPAQPQGAEVKALVDQTVVALQKNDQMTAIMNLETLRNNSAQLTVDQFTAVQDMMARAQTALAQRAAAGDPQAIAALEAMRYKHR